MTLRVAYPKRLESSAYGGAYIQPVVLIEMGIRSTPEPVMTQPIQSFIEESMHEADPIHVSLLRPERTFWEKVTLLHAENSRNEPERIQKRNRMSRHLYDIVKLYESDFGQQALGDAKLLERVAQHKLVFFKDNKARYDEAVPDTLRLVPEGEMRVRLREDYKEMAEAMFAHIPPSFDEIMATLQTIELAIRKL
jgi:hypothetical protein